MTGNYSFVSAEAIEAMRCTGYKTTAHAIAELVDNSIQAGATDVTLIVEIEPEFITQRTRKKVKRIAVLDNGSGMDYETLKNALAFGFGTHRNDRHGIGKFGVGLPQASISQAQMVSAWSWQNGVKSAMTTGIDLSDIEWRRRGAILADPKDSGVPQPWSNFIDTSKKTGTIVVWSKLDKCDWSNYNKLYSNTELLLGRIYRNWLNNKVTIEMIFIDGDNGKELERRKFRAVDPLFVMKNTSAVDYDPPVDPMFEELEPFEMPITYNGVQSKIIIRTSIAKPEVRMRKGKTWPGALPYGKHAAENIGLSIVREGRELELDPAWTASTHDPKDPRHRWWGAEVQFTRELDEVFGVTNDKQHATRLKPTSDGDFVKLDGETTTQARDRLMVEDPITCINACVTHKIKEMIDNAYNKIPKEVDDKSTTDSEEGQRRVAEKIASAAIQKQVEEEGPKGVSDALFKEPLEKREKELVEGLEAGGAKPEEIKEAVKNVITFGYKCHFIKRNIPESDAFFSVEPQGGALIIYLNAAHPLYDELFGTFDAFDENKREDYTNDELWDMITDTYDSIKLMLEAWARLEDISTKERRIVMNIRRDWGRIAQEFRNTEISDIDG